MTEDQRAGWRDLLRDQMGTEHDWHWADGWMKAAAKADGTLSKITATHVKMLQRAFGVRDPELDPVTDRTFRTKFIEHLLHTNSAAEEIRLYSKGIADFRMRLYWEHFRNIRVCLPPLEEQDAILSAIERQTRKIETLVAATDRSIVLLKEKSAALITAAVTGKIEVRSAA